MPATDGWSGRPGRFPPPPASPLSRLEPRAPPSIPAAPPGATDIPRPSSFPSLVILQSPRDHDSVPARPPLVALGSAPGVPRPPTQSGRGERSAWPGPATLPQALVPRDRAEAGTACAPTPAVSHARSPSPPRPPTQWPRHRAPVAPLSSGPRAADSYGLFLLDRKSVV